MHHIALYFQFYLVVELLTADIAAPPKGLLAICSCSSFFILHCSSHCAIISMQCDIVASIPAAVALNVTALHRKSAACVASDGIRSLISKNVIIELISY